MLPVTCFMPTADEDQFLMYMFSLCAYMMVKRPILDPAQTKPRGYKYIYCLLFPTAAFAKDLQLVE